jgi:hypothetical protein
MRTHEISFKRSWLAPQPPRFKSRLEKMQRRYEARNSLHQAYETDRICSEILGISASQPPIYRPADMTLGVRAGKRDSGVPTTPGHNLQPETKTTPTDRNQAENVGQPVDSRSDLFYVGPARVAESKSLRGPFVPRTAEAAMPNHHQSPSPATDQPSRGSFVNDTVMPDADSLMIAVSGC